MDSLAIPSDRKYTHSSLYPKTFNRGYHSTVDQDHFENSIFGNQEESNIKEKLKKVEKTEFKLNAVFNFFQKFLKCKKRVRIIIKYFFKLSNTNFKSGKNYKF